VLGVSSISVAKTTEPVAETHSKTSFVPDSVRKQQEKVKPHGSFFGLSGEEADASDDDDDVESEEEPLQDEPAEVANRAVTSVVSMKVIESESLVEPLAPTVEDLSQQKPTSKLVAVSHAGVGPQLPPPPAQHSQSQPVQPVAQPSKPVFGYGKKPQAIATQASTQSLLPTPASNYTLAASNSTQYGAVPLHTAVPDNV
jgi:hypothetical protein